MPNLRFTEADWDRVERDTMAWWTGDLERPLVHLTTVDPLLNAPNLRFLSNYPLDMPIEDVVDRYEPVFAAMNFYGDAYPKWWTNFGPGIMAGFVGATVNSVSDPSETVWYTPSNNVPITDMEIDFDPDNIWWQRVKDFTAAIVKRWDGMVAVGHTDLGGGLDILASLRETEGLLFDVMDHPDEVDRLAGCITDLWLRYYDKLDAMIRPACRGTTCWAPVWSTSTTYMLQCDFSYMISPAMFERFVMPDLIACCDHLDHGFYHLDGKGEIPHLDLLLSIPRLRGIQWIPGDGAPPPEEWLPLLKRIRDGGKLCQVFVTPEGARTIVKNLGGRGFLLAIGADEDEFRDPERAHAFLKTLAEEDISLQK